MLKYAILSYYYTVLRNVILRMGHPEDALAIWPGALLRSTTAMMNQDIDSNIGGDQRDFKPRDCAENRGAIRLLVF